MKKNLLSLFFIIHSLLTACLQEGVEFSNDNARPPARAKEVEKSPSPARPHPANSEPDLSPNTPDPIRPDAPTLNENLITWFSVRSNYNIVIQDVRKFYEPVRYNGCVAFISAALRRIGVPIPISAGSKESPSLVTRPFYQHLERELGWVRIGAASHLKPGDIVFTKDNPSYPGYPAHTYVFKEWSKKSMGIALVIDNQDFTHERNIYDNDTEFNFTPYAFALRAP